jgi:UDP-N-acetylenolpyruvoylglucosamine reductase
MKLIRRISLEKKDAIQALVSQWKENNIAVISDAPMKEYTSFKAGGNAAALVIVESAEQLQQVLADVAEAGVPSMLLGNGSNTLFKDSG